jgi:hypothetical protein
MMALRPESKKRILDFCYSNYFRREYRTLKEYDFQKFKEVNEYFLCDIENVDYRFEFAFYLFFKWVRRLGIKFTKEEIKEYLIKRTNFKRK